MDTDGHGAKELWTTLSEACVLYGVRLLAALAILLVGRWLAQVLSRMLNRSFAQAHMEATLATFLKNLNAPNIEHEHAGAFSKSRSERTIITFSVDDAFKSVCLLRYKTTSSMLTCNGGFI